VENYGLLGKNTLQLKGRNLAGPNLLWAKRTVAAQKCGLLSERVFLAVAFFFTIDFAIFLLPLEGHIFVFFKLIFWQVFIVHARGSDFEEKQIRRRTKRKKGGHFR